MNRAELVEQVAERAQLSRPDARRAVDAALSIVNETLASGGTVSLSGFGRFHVALRGGRRAVNPRTGEPIQVPDTWVPRFTAGTNLKHAARVSARRNNGR